MPSFVDVEVEAIVLRHPDVHGFAGHVLRCFREEPARRIRAHHDPSTAAKQCRGDLRGADGVSVAVAADVQRDRKGHLMRP